MRTQCRRHQTTMVPCCLLVALSMTLVAVVEINATSRLVKQCTFDNELRLPKRLRPIHYELTMRPDLEARSYTGQVRLQLEIGLDDRCKLTRARANRTGEPQIPFGCNQKELILNAAELDITSARYFQSTQRINPGGSRSSEIPVDEICLDHKEELVAIRLAEELDYGASGELVVNFTGQLRTDGQGFYLDQYLDRRNQSRLSCVTHFEAPHARRAFPCLDEPEYKATFDVIVEHPSELEAISNMEMLDRTPLATTAAGGDGDGDGDGDGNPMGLVRTRFATTPPMSTYLVAFAVGDYDTLESKISDGKLTLRMIVPPNQSPKARRALDTARRAYAALKDYFELEQPLKKIDFISLKEMRASAMENWGLITSSRQFILHDGQSTSPLTAARSVVVIAHELAHQWFGNLVTMKWWDNLWLNEAFAEWISYKIADEIYPELDYHFFYLQESHLRGLKADAEGTTHPIRNLKLDSIHAIERSFDAVTYAKGASVVRMLSNYMGEENFKLAIRDYMRQFSFGNTDERDLWGALQARSGLPIGELMHSWLDQPGYPVLEVSLGANDTSSGDGKDTPVVRIRQERFVRDLSLPGAGAGAPTAAGADNNSNNSTQRAKQLWMVPISMIVSSGGGGHQPTGRREVLKFMLSEEQMEVRLPEWFDAGAGGWFKLNADFDGFYRCHYHRAVLETMGRAISAKQMDPIDRLNVLDDINAMYSFGRIELDEVELVLGWLRDEDHPGVVYKMTQLLEMLRDLSSGRSELPLLLVQYYAKIRGFQFAPNEPIIESRARQGTLSLLVHANYPPALAEGLEIFERATAVASNSTSNDDDDDDEETRTTTGGVPVEIREPVYAAVAQNGTTEQMERLRVILNQMEETPGKRHFVDSVLQATDWERKDVILREEMVFSL